MSESDLSIEVAQRMANQQANELRAVLRKNLPAIERKDFAMTVGSVRRYFTEIVFSENPLEDQHVKLSRKSVDAEISILESYLPEPRLLVEGFMAPRIEQLVRHDSLHLQRMDPQKVNQLAAKLANVGESLDMNHPAGSA